MLYYSGTVCNYENQDSIVFTDVDGTILNGYLNDMNKTIYTDYKITAPKDAKKVYITSYSTTPVLKTNQKINIKDMKNKTDSIEGFS